MKQPQPWIYYMDALFELMGDSSSNNPWFKPFGAPTSVNEMVENAFA